MFTTRRADAQNPLDGAIDVGSTARAGVYDVRGLPLRNSKTKVQHAFTTLNDGTSTIDPDQVADEIRRCINFCTDAVGAPIAGVAIDTFVVAGRRGRRRARHHPLLHVRRQPLRAR